MRSTCPTPAEMAELKLTAAEWSSFSSTDESSRKDTCFDLILENDIENRNRFWVLFTKQTALTST